MKKFIKRVSNYIFSPQHDILASALTLAFMFGVSRLFGLLRYRTFATYFTRSEIDIFLSSFRLPDFIFEIVITGALSSAFIPIYIKYSKQEKNLTKVISSIVNCIIIFLFLFIIIFVIFAPHILKLLLPGYDHQGAVFLQIVYFSRILMLAQLPFLVIGSLLTGIAQANKVFLATTLAPLLYNLSIILATIFTHKDLGIMAPLLGVSVGAVLYLLVQIPILKKTKFHYKLKSFSFEHLKEFFRLFVPRVLTVLSSEIDITIDLMLSSLLERGSYTIFIFAQNLHLVPVSLVGMAFGQASLPYLADMFAQNKKSEIKQLVTSSLLQLLFLSIPLSIFLIFAQTPIVRIVFGGKKFDWLGTNFTADTLMIFALAIPFHTIFYFLVRSFYAMHDSRTPFYISLSGVIINSLVSSFCVIYLKLPVWSLALAFTVSIIFNVSSLMIVLYRRLGKSARQFSGKYLITQTAKIYFIALSCAPLPYGIMKVLDPLILDTSKTFNVIILLSIISVIYFGLYGLIAWGANLEQIYLIGGITAKFKSLRKKVSELFIDLGE